METDGIRESERPPVALDKRGATGEMDKDAFLQLMIIQMQHQDPLNPMDNQAMLAQMAQFTSLEQMGNLNKTLSNGNAIQQFMSATGLIGKEVAVRDPYSDPDNPEFFKSIVHSVSKSKDGAILQLENGMPASLDQLVKINDNSNHASEALNAMKLIGKEVAVLDPNSDPSKPRYTTGLVESVSHDEVGAILHLKNGKPVYAHHLVEIATADPEDYAAVSKVAEL